MESLNKVFYIEPKNRRFFLELTFLSALNLANTYLVANEYTSNIVGLAGFIAITALQTLHLLREFTKA